MTFCCHDESVTFSNRGNFVELLDLLGQYNSNLRSFLDNEKIKYTLHDPQNDFIECIYEKVSDEIQKQVEKSIFVSVMIDNTSDLSNVKQWTNQQCRNRETHDSFD